MNQVEERRREVEERRREAEERLAEIRRKVAAEVGFVPRRKGWLMVIAAGAAGLALAMKRRSRKKLAG